MDSSNTGNYYILFASIIVCVVAYLLLSRKKLNFPPGPLSLPIVGYYPFLGDEPHRTLTELSRKYGKIFSINVGTSTVVILSDFELMKEAFNRSETADRHKDLFRFMPGGFGFGSTNGRESVEQRKYTMRSMRDLGLGKSQWEVFVQEEVGDFLNFLEKLGGNPSDVRSRLLSSISNNVLSLVFGYRFSEDDPKKIAIRKGLDAFPQFFLPTGLICQLPGLVIALEKIGIRLGESALKDLNEFNQFVRDEVDLIKSSTKERTEGAYVDGYLTKMKEEEKSKGNGFNEAFLIGNIQALISGGAETIRTTLMWLFLEMALYPSIQEKVYKEVSSVLGQNDRALWVNRSKFPYTYATVMETLRWRTITPLNLSHSTREDIKIAGYDVPKDTAIIGLLWALHNDTKYWENPEKFYPERFIDENGGVMTRPDSWLPFSMGKRICPGDTVAMVELFLYFTSIIQKFEIQKAHPQQTLDMKGSSGLILQPKSQQLRFLLRNK